ncbi:MAG: hypothetical protein WBB29_07390 [Geitlerinemataceae cyanobacterium]
MFAEATDLPATPVRVLYHIKVEILGQSSIGAIARSSIDYGFQDNDRPTRKNRVP